MFWIDLSEHNLSVWDARGSDELHSEEGDIIVMPIKPIGEDSTDQLIKPFTQSGGFYDKTINAVRLKRIPLMDFWMDNFDKASIRWLPSSETKPQVAINENEKRFVRSEQWLFAAVDPNPSALGLNPGSHLSPNLTVYALTEVDALAIGNEAITVPSGRVYPIAEHPEMDGVLYGVPRDQYNPLLNYADELPVYDKASEPTQIDEAVYAIDDIVDDIVDDLVAATAIDQIDGENESSQEGSESGKRTDYGRVIPGSRKSLFISIRDLRDRDNDTDTRLEIREVIKTKMTIAKTWPKKDMLELIKNSGDALPLAILASSVRDNLYPDYAAYAPLRGRGNRSNKYLSAGQLVSGGISVMTATMTARNEFEAAIANNESLSNLVHRLTTDTMTNPRSSSYEVLNRYLERAINNPVRATEIKSKEIGVNASMFVDPYWVTYVRYSSDDFDDLKYDDKGTIDTDWLMEKSAQVRLPGQAISHALKSGSLDPFWLKEAMGRSLQDLGNKSIKYIGLKNSLPLKALTNLSSQLREIGLFYFNDIKEDFKKYQNDLGEVSSIRANQIKAEIDQVKSRDHEKVDALIKETMDAIRTSDKLGVSAFDRIAEVYKNAILDIEKLLKENGVDIRDVLSTDIIDLEKKVKKQLDAEDERLMKELSSGDSGDNKNETDDETPPKVNLGSMPINFPKDVVLSASNGINWRSGRDVTEEQLCNRFGFSGIQYGNYVNQSRRSEMLNSCYDALCDIAYATELPDRFMGLNGGMALAFGARGRGGRNAASAHYEPALKVINFTRYSGAGMLAHEMAHSWDNYFGKLAGAPVYLSESIKDLRERVGHSIINEDSVKIITSMNRFITRYKTKVRDVPESENQSTKSLSAARNLIYSDFEKKAFGEKRLSYVFRGLVFAAHKDSWPGEKDSDALRQIAFGLKGRIGEFIEKSKDSGASHLLRPGSLVFDWSDLESRISAWAESTGKPLSSTERVAVEFWADGLYPEVKKMFNDQRGSKVGNKSIKIGANESGFSHSGVVLDAASSRKSAYWSSDIEYFARAMSSVINQIMTEEGVRNDWAAGISRPSVFDGAEYLNSPNLEGVELIEATKVFRESFLPAIREIAILEVGSREITEAEQSMHEDRLARQATKPMNDTPTGGLKNTNDSDQNHN